MVQRRLLKNILKNYKQTKENSTLKIQLGFRQKLLGVCCDKSFFCQVKVLQRVR